MGPKLERQTNNALPATHPLFRPPPELRVDARHVQTLRGTGLDENSKRYRRALGLGARELS